MSYFDDAPVRRGTGSYKWDDTDDPDIIPIWVADMDFRTAPVVIDALRKRVEHGVFGYTLVGDDYYESLTNWFSRRHGYKFNANQVIYTSGVVPALSAIIKALAPAGKGVIVQTPVYNCFFSSIRNNGCKIIEAPLKRVDIDSQSFTYSMDYEALEQACALPDTTLMLLCNPHNPAGRCWNVEELEKVRDICKAHGVRVISDEIHCELTMPGFSYVPYGSIDSDAVVCLSPSKAFNTAGLQIANIVCPDSDVKEAVNRAININEVCDVNPFGPEALKASYSSEGEKWLESLKAYLWENWLFTRATLAKRLPQCPVTVLEATYLPWVDVKSLGIESHTLEEILKKEAKVWVNAGDMYGKKGFIRLNIACPRHTLAQALDRLCSYIEKIK